MKQESLGGYLSMTYGTVVGLEVFLGAFLLMHVLLYKSNELNEIR